MAPRTQRDYSTVIADSPVRHALFNKPFTSLRRRTENLLDNITGATTAEEIIEAERREKERTRALTCRFCRVVYANEHGLSKHYDMFPAHLVDERPRRKSREPSQSSIKTESAALNRPPPPAMPDRQALMQHSRAKSSPNLYASRHHDAVPSSRPRPTPASPPIPSVPSMPFISSHRSDNATPHRSAGTSPEMVSPSRIHAASPPVAPPPQQAASPPVRTQHVASPAESRSASDFYSPASNGGYNAMYDPSFGASPYALPNAMLSSPGMPSNAMFATSPMQQPPSAMFMAPPTQPMQHHHNVPLSQWQHTPAALPPRATAMLPNFDFESRFRTITLDGVNQPPSAQAHPVTYSPSAYERQAAERNREAGARSAARLPPVYTGTAAIQEEPSEEGHHDVDPRQQRALRRGATDSQLVVTATNTGAHMPAMPNTLGGVVRAVVATAATGPRGQPVMPSQSSPVRQKSPNAAWVPLSDDDDQRDERGPPGESKTTASAFLKHTRGMSSSSSGRPWGALLEGLPGSPQEEKRLAVQELPAVGSTSFSDNAAADKGGSGSGADGGKRARRNTNPFLNRDFMRGLPTALKTPPLTPTSPWGLNGGSASPGNPFQQLSGEDEAVDDGESDTAAYFDAPAAEEARRSPTKSKTLPGAFV